LTKIPEAKLDKLSNLDFLNFKEAQRAAVRLRMMEFNQKNKKSKVPICSTENLPPEVKNRKFDFMTIIKIIKFQRSIKRFVAYIRKIKFLQREISDFLFFKKHPFLNKFTYIMKLNNAYKIIEPLEDKLYLVKKQYFHDICLGLYRLISLNEKKTLEINTDEEHIKEQSIESSFEENQNDDQTTNLLCSSSDNNANKINENLVLNLNFEIIEENNKKKEIEELQKCLEKKNLKSYFNFNDINTKKHICYGFLYEKNESQNNISNNNDNNKRRFIFLISSNPNNLANKDNNNQDNNKSESLSLSSSAFVLPNGFKFDTLYYYSFDNNEDDSKHKLEIPIR
jgi:hypothetical protein